MLYRLSKLIPVRMHTEYTLVLTPDGQTEPLHEQRERASWWQWRSRVFRVRTAAL